jgi:hypothetical protein
LEGKGSLRKQSLERLVRRVGTPSGTGEGRENMDCASWWVEEVACGHVGCSGNWSHCGSWHGEHRKQ